MHRRLGWGDVESIGEGFGEGTMMISPHLKKKLIFFCLKWRVLVKSEQHLLKIWGQFSLASHTSISEGPRDLRPRPYGPVSSQMGKYVAQSSLEANST